MSNKAYLENMMIGETVIYCDNSNVKYPAMILRPISDEVVDLLVFYDGDKGGTVTLAGVPFNHNIEPLPNTWYRRNKI